MKELVLERSAGLGCWSGLTALVPALRAYLQRRCRADIEVEDILQETLLRAARYRQGLADPGRLRAWSMRIAENALRDHLQRELRLPRCETSDDELERIAGRETAPGQENEDELVSLGAVVLPRAEAFALLEESIASLHSDDAGVLRSYYEAPVQSCRRLACQLEVRPEVFKMRLFRARRRLAGMMRAQLTTAGGA